MTSPEPRHLLTSCSEVLPDTLVNACGVGRHLAQRIGEQTFRGLVRHPTTSQVRITL